MALKGSAVIELTNVKTGETERYEEHNMVTKALEYLHTPIGNLKSPTDCTFATEPSYKGLLGGILLLDTALEEDASNVILPTSVNVVGCACYNQTNTTTSPKRGSYNEAESYLTTSSTERSIAYSNLVSGLERLRLVSDSFGEEYIISTQDFETIMKGTWLE